MMDSGCSPILALRIARSLMSVAKIWIGACETLLPKKSSSEIAIE